MPQMSTADVCGFSFFGACCFPALRWLAEQALRWGMPRWLWARYFFFENKGVLNAFVALKDYINSLSVSGIKSLFPHTIWERT